jgi:hypothetical protein
MTITALVVLTMALAAEKGGPVPAPAAPAPAAWPATPASGRAGATCALRVVHVPPAFDSGILAPPPRRFGDAIAGDDAIVRDSLSSCAGVAGRRVSGSGIGER